jgi:CBS domain-containing protein
MSTERASGPTFRGRELERRRGSSLARGSFEGAPGMSQRIREIMTEGVVKLPSSATLFEAARQMRDADVGSVVVEDEGRVVGLVTDRDLVVRALADGRDPETTPLSEVASTNLVTVSPDDDMDLAIEIMIERSLRRVLVLERGKIVGIVSLGDLAIERDRLSVLGHISSARPNH